jgi:uncharacterized protein (TIGR03067 family)
MRPCTLAALTVGLVIAGLATQSAAQQKEDAVKEELKKLQGTWTLVALEKDGKEVPPDKLKEANIKVTIKGTSFSFMVGGKTIEGSFTIDPAKSPKHLDAKGPNAQGAEEKTIGIYKLEGDTLRICFVPEGKQRPTEFKSQADTGTTLETFRRDK